MDEADPMRGSQEARGCGEGGESAGARSGLRTLRAGAGLTWGRWAGRNSVRSQIPGWQRPREHSGRSGGPGSSVDSSLRQGKMTLSRGNGP